MRRQALRAPVLAVLVLALLPSQVFAAQDKELSFGIGLGTDHGMQVALDGGADEAGDLVLVTVTRDSRDEVLTTRYFFSRKVKLSARRIDADLGEFGRVALRFRERDRDEISYPDDCKGVAGDVFATERFGTFRGRYRFQGESGYVSAGGRRAPGVVTVTEDYRCELAERRAPKPIALSTCPRRETDPLYFAERTGRTVSHVATDVARQAGGIVIAREVFFAGGSDSFLAAKDLSAAMVTPSGPFSGTGAYGNEMLTGDLAVEMLGLEMPLSLAPAEARLERGGDSGAGCPSPGSTSFQG